jgi:hypothetical protein
MLNIHSITESFLFSKVLSWIRLHLHTNNTVTYPWCFFVCDGQSRVIMFTIRQSERHFCDWDQPIKIIAFVGLFHRCEWVGSQLWMSWIYSCETVGSRSWTSWFTAMVEFGAQASIIEHLAMTTDDEAMTMPTT